MNVDVVGRLFTVAVVAIVALTGCSRTQPEPPHTRLGVP